MKQLTLDEAIGVLVSASDVRAQQWEGVEKGERPDSLIDELWEAGESEAEFLADRIRAALDIVRAARPVNG